MGTAEQVTHEHAAVIDLHGILIVQAFPLSQDGSLLFMAHCQLGQDVAGRMNRPSQLVCMMGSFWVELRHHGGAGVLLLAGPNAP